MQMASAIEVTRLLVSIGVLLLRSGAHTTRTTRNLKRFAASFGYKPEIFIAYSGITITIFDEQSQHITLFGRVENHGVHLATVAAISQLSWRVADEPCSIAMVRQEIKKIRQLPHYPRWQILLMVGIACGALARLAGAEWPIVGITTLAAAVALLVRMLLTDHKFNQLLAVMISAMTATIIASTASLFQMGETSGLAIASSVLFLIPGVPLINSVIDMINGHMTIGMGRGAIGGAISLALACGMLGGMQLMGVSL